MEPSSIQRLSEKVDQLLEHCRELENERAELKSQQHEWQSERAKLLEKNDLARNKIEAMIGRLKSLEQS